MICPKCRSTKSYVIRTETLGKQKRRLRCCKKCNTLFETIEETSSIYKKQAKTCVI